MVGTSKATPSTSPGGVVTLNAQERAFADRLDLAGNIRNTQMSSYNIWLNGICLAYADAWEEHIRFVEKVNKDLKLQGDVIFSFALTFLPAVVGSLSASAGGMAFDGLAKNKLKDLDLVAQAQTDLARQKAMLLQITNIKSTARDLVRDVAKDMTKNLVQKAQPQIARADVLPIDVGSAFPVDNPTAWTLKMEQPRNSVTLLIDKVLETWRTNLLTKSGMDITFDPAQVVKELCVLQRPLDKTFVSMSDLDPPNQVGLSFTYQKGWLKGWIQTFGASAFGTFGSALLPGLFWSRTMDILTKEADRIGFTELRETLIKNGLGKFTDGI